MPSNDLQSLQRTYNRKSITINKRRKPSRHAEGTALKTDPTDLPIYAGAILYRLRHIPLANKMQRLQLVIPLWMKDANVMQYDGGVYRENFYEFNKPQTVEDRAKMLLLDPKCGVTDLWASMINITLGTIMVPEASVPMLGTLFDDMKRDFLDQGTFTAAHPLAVGINKVLSCSAPGNPFEAKKPFYGAQWVLSNPESRKTWHEFACFSHQFIQTIRKIFSLGGPAMHNASVRDHSCQARSIILRKYSEALSTDAAQLLETFNSSGLTVHGLQGQALELCIGGGTYNPRPDHGLCARPLVLSEQGKDAALVILDSKWPGLEE